jgi:hypothetical protein
VSKLPVPFLEFPVARRPEETNDGFRVRVELAVMNVVGRYVYGEHKACVETVLNGGWVNRVSEPAGVPYGPRLEPGSEACKEAAKKRKSDTGAGTSGKHMKVSGRKGMLAKASVAPKGMDAAPSKTVLAKATYTTQASKAGMVLGTSVPPRVATRSGVAVLKITVTVAVMVTMSRAGVLKISTSVKSPAAALSPAMKGKHAKVDARPPPALVTPCAILVRQPVAARADTNRVTYCAILDSVPSAELCSSSSNDSFSSESVMASPPPVPDVHISVELPPVIEVPEVEVAEQEVAVDTEAHTASLEGWFSQFLQISHSIISCGDFDFGCIGVHDDGGVGGNLHQLA